jgi:muramidase (phage lysozyme)
LPIQILGYEQKVGVASGGGSPALRAPTRPTINLSGEVDQLARSFEKIEDDQAETEAMKAVASTRMGVETSYQKAQETAKPGADGFTPGIMKDYDGAVTETANGLSSELARKKYNEKMLGFGVNLQNRAVGWEADQRRTERKQSFVKAADDHASTLFSTDAGNRGSSYDLMKNEIDTSLASVDLPPDQKEELRQSIKAKMSYAAVQGDLRDRPDTVQDALVKGTGAAYYSQLRATESGGRNIGSSSSSAYGPYQFLSGTWDALIEKHPELNLTKKDRFDPMAQEAAIRAFTKDNADVLKAHGIPTNNVNLYMAHFLGSGGGVEFINAVRNRPTDPATSAVSPAVVAANPGVFRKGRTVQDVYLLFGQKFGGAATAEAPMSAPSYYNDLDFKSRNALYDQADTEMRKRRTEGAAAFKQQTDNIVAQYASQGYGTTDVTEQSFVAAYGPNAGTVRYGEFQAATIGAKAQHDLKTLDLAQHGQYLESIRPDSGDEFYAEKLKGFEQAKAVSLQVRNAVKEDAAGYVAGYNPAIPAALAKISNIDNSDDATRKAAVADYINQMNAEYDRLGVSEGQRRAVPKYYADEVGGMLQARLDSDANATQTVALLNRYAQSWGSEWPRVYADMSDKMSAPLKVITSGIRPGAATVLASVSNQSFDDIAKVFDKTKRTTLQTSLQSEFEPFVKASGFQASAMPNISTFYEQGLKLSAVYVGQGEDPTNAAARAYDDLVGFKYRMVSDSGVNVRIPKPLDTPDMERALDTERSAIIEKGGIQRGQAVPGAPLTDDARASRTRSWLGRNASFVTLPDDSGVALAVGGKVWRDDKGAPITRTWAQIRDSLKASDKTNFDEFGVYIGER